ncbi:MAG TPA: hypothetical protein VFV94_03355 [Polyangiaceae bacterium]|nr:hypothetical protein [Polyangiaceae bacterium]
MSPVRADAAKPAASMACRIEPGSGRLFCTVRIAAPEGRAVSWSDALVVAAPRAARALKSRVTSRSDRPGEVVLAFVLGSGEGGRIEVLARAVTCPVAPRSGACTPLSERVAYDFRPGT